MNSVNIILSFMLLSIACAQTVPRTISVSGRGVASGAPDTASINTGVVTTAKTAQAALAENNKLFKAVLAVLAKQGVDSRDVQTTFFNVNPQFERKPNGERGPLTGYSVTNEVRVTVRNLDSLGLVLDALVSAGSNRVSGIRFSIEDNKSLLVEARRLAVADAISRAKVYAAAAGVRLGKVLGISEQGVSAPSEQRFAALSSSAKSVPIATGELDVSASVFLQFSIA